MTNKDLQEKILARLVELIESFEDSNVQKQHSIKEEVDLLLKIAAAIGGLNIATTYGGYNMQSLIDNKYKPGDIRYTNCSNE